MKSLSFLVVLLSLAACGGSDSPVDTVKAMVAGHSVVFRGAALQPACTDGHKGFNAQTGVLQLQLSAFVFAPGTFHCHEPQPFISVLWTGEQPAGEYEISPFPGTSGSCELVVDTLQPRFKGRLTAMATRTQGTGDNEVAIQATVDMLLPAAACK